MVDGCGIFLLRGYDWPVGAQTEGVGSFYDGMRTKMVQSVLASALMFMLKEEIDRAVRKALRGNPKPKVATA